MGLSILVHDKVCDPYTYICIFKEEVLCLDSLDSDGDEIRQLKSQLRRVHELRKKSTLDSDP